MIKYIAKDGSQWDSEADAEKREDLIDKINSAMSRLNAIPDDIDFSNGRWFILQDRESVNAARREIYELCKPYLSWWFADQKARYGKTDEELHV